MKVRRRHEDTPKLAMSPNLKNVSRALVVKERNAAIVVSDVIRHAGPTACAAMTR